MEFTKGFSRKIDEQFTIKIANDDENDFQRILDLNVLVHGEPVRDYLSRIYLEHPRKDQILWLYIEETDSNKVVSSISLMPLKWKFNDITIPVSEMGFVGTLEKYRERGFIGELNHLYEQLMFERGYLISVIRGIPYYYRKLGYEFAMPLDDRMRLSANKIPSTKLNHLHIRKAKLEDIEFVKEMYENYQQDFFISNKFNIDLYVFKHFSDEYNEFKSICYIIEYKGAPSAFFTFGMSYDNLAYDIKASHLNDEQCLKMLQFIKEITHSKMNEKLDLCAREDSDLGRKILSLGGAHYHTYGWQVKIPNLKQFFEKIKVILEKRINNSIFKILTQNIKISNYKETIELILTNGKVAAIQLEKGYPKEGTCDLQVPGPMLNKLLIGDRSFEEINYIVKDAMIRFEVKDIINTLFPKKSSVPDSYY
ncbi:MAG: GNAT family N-acetyltransferase [Promethearchaeota archaeon]|nr:MAG: GNAT family N-acetyltransferase [Candidatus Lokiarchaeota archaeon]